MKYTDIMKSVRMISLEGKKQEEVSEADLRNFWTVLGL